MNQPAEPAPQAYPADESAALRSPAHPLPGAESPAPNESLPPAAPIASAAPAVPGAPPQGGTPHGATPDGSVPDDATPDGGPTDGGSAPTKRRWPVAVAVVVVVALVLSGAGYAGLRAWYGWGTTQPERVLPAGVAAFARVDLSPGYRDKLNVAKLLKKFPASKRDGAAGVVDSVEKSAFEGSGLDFDTDVQPWFADRAGAALWLRDGKPVPVLALASSDDAKAKTALAKVRATKDSRLGYAFLDGYVLVVDGSAGGQGAADAAVAAAKAHPLAQDAGYLGAIRKLPGNNLAFGYTDLAKIGAVAVGALAGGALASGALAGNAAVAGAAGAAGTGLDPKALNALGLDTLTGTVAAGASVVSDGIEVHIRGTGLPKSGTPGQDVRGTLGGLPGSSFLALSTNGSTPSASGSTSPVSGLLGAAAAGALGLTDPTGGPDAGDAAGDDGIGSDGPDLADDPEFAAAFLAQMQQFVTALTDGVQAVLTAKLVSLAVTSAGDSPRGVLQVQPRDADAAAALAKLGTLFGDVPGLTVKQDGTGLRAALGDGGNGGTLTDSALFQRALTGAPTNTTSAGYIDVAHMLTATHASAQTAAAWGPVQAIGLAMGTSDGDLTGLVRIVVK